MRMGSASRSLTRDRGKEQWQPHHLAKNERDMGHPSFVREREALIQSSPSQEGLSLMLD